MTGELPYHPERGAALLTVLFVFSICATVALAMLDRQKIDVESAASLTGQAQGYEYALGAEDLARQALANDAALTPGIVFPGQRWGRLSQGMAIDGGTVALAIEDLQGRFNVNALAGGRDLPRQRFKVLLAQLKIDAKIADAVVARLGTAAAPRLLTDIDDLRALDGFDPDDFARLRPYLTALPDPDSLLNVNTAPSVVLKAYIPDDRNYARMTQSLQQRGYLTQPQMNAAGMSTEGMGVDSDYFRVNAVAQWHGRVVTLKSTLARGRDDAGSVAFKILARDLSHD